MRVLAMRVMMTGNSDGKITRAVLQHQIESGYVSDGTYRCVWEDVRELPITPDGRVTLGMIPEPEQVEIPQAFIDAFKDKELEL